jgi:DNA-binding MarR family transcriptional regulator
MSSDEDPGPLTLPTDKNLLNELLDGKRQTPKNLSVILDADRTYLSNRLRALEHKGFDESPGPADRSGMYEISDAGRVAMRHFDRYAREHDETYTRLCKRVAETNTNNTDTVSPDQIPLFSERENAARHAIDAIDGLTIPSEFAEQTGLDITVEEAAELLYTLYFFGYVERKDGMNVYAPIDQG